MLKRTNNPHINRLSSEGRYKTWKNKAKYDELFPHLQN